MLKESRAQQLNGNANRNKKVGRSAKIADLECRIDMTDSEMNLSVGGKPWYEKESTYVGAAEVGVEVGGECVE